MYNFASYTRLSVLLLFITLGTGCKKFLDEKPDKKLAVPQTLQDLRLMLDFYGLFNTQHPAGGEIASDDYYLTQAAWAGLSTESYRNNYLWLPDDAATTDWLPAYERIYYANVILREAERVPRTAADEEAYNTIRGSALFARGFSFYGLAQVFAKPYEETTAGQDLGLPLRLDPDHQKPSVRATVRQTYDQLIADLQQAARLLPLDAEPRSRPSKLAAWSAMARVFLSMRRYTLAAAYADSVLQQRSALLDYNTLNTTAPFPFPIFNTEVIWEAGSLALPPLAQSRWRVDSTLYASYATNDLRKTLFFKPNGDGSYAFKGSYQGTTAPFTGLATDEMYLVRAEGRARAGETGLALADLNTLLEKRWREGTFVPLTAATPAQALALILAERRKQLVFRSLRWTDLRRLSFEPALALTPKRVMNNQQYVLPPGSPRYVLRIPRTVIQLSGMPQNP